MSTVPLNRQPTLQRLAETGSGPAGVTSVAAGDATITVAGTASAPTVKVAKTLDHTYVTDLGGAATKNVGTATGTVAAGDDSRFLPAPGVSDAGKVLTVKADHSGWEIDPLPTGVASFNTRTGTVTLTKADVTGTGLGPADISAVATAAVGAAGGVATLDGSSHVPVGQLANALGLPLGLAGATAATRYVGATASGAPVSGTFAVGDFVIDRTGTIWICTAAGTPGTWAAPSGGGGGAGVSSFNTRTGAVTLAKADVTGTGLAASDVGAAPTGRQVISGTGLTGGGDLSADRTLAVSYGTTAGTATQGNDSRITSALRLTRTAVKTANYTAAAGDLVPADTTSGSITVTLPTAPATGTCVAVKHIIQGGTNTVTVARGGTDVFNKAGGSTTLTLSLGALQSLLVQYDAGSAIWTVLAVDIPSNLMVTSFNTRTGAVTLSKADVTGTGLAASDVSAVATAAVGAAGGVATLDGSSHVPVGQLANALGLPLGLAGATAATRYVGATASGAPVSGTFAVGDFVIDRTGTIWICTAAGTPGTWAAPSGGASGVSSFNTRTGAVTLAKADVTGTGLAAADVSAAPTSRQVIAGTGLTGGGDLTADRTLAVSYGTASGTAAQGNDSRFTTVTANAQTASYTLVLADAGGCVEMNVAGANTLTVPPNSSVAFPVGTVLEVCQLGAGQTTITAGAGVTIRNPSSLTTRAQYSTLALRKRGTDEWVLSGDVT